VILSVEIIFLFCPVLPHFDEMCRCFLNFITRCYFSDSEMIQFVVIVHVPPLLLVVISSFVTNGLVLKFARNFSMVANVVRLNAPLIYS